jgi:hypothetical protein
VGKTTNFKFPRNGFPVRAAICKEMKGLDYRELASGVKSGQ